jgi:hypothetical protein
VFNNFPGRFSKKTTTNALAYFTTINCSILLITAVNCFLYLLPDKCLINSGFPGRFSGQLSNGRGKSPTGIVRSEAEDAIIREMEAQSR